MKMGAEFWSAHVAAAKLETISASEYARRHGIAVSALYYWQRKLKVTGKAIAASRPGKFVALRVADTAQRPCSCTLALPSGLRLEMSALPAPEWLAALEHAALGAR